MFPTNSKYLRPCKHTEVKAPPKNVLTFVHKMTQVLLEQEDALEASAQHMGLTHKHALSGIVVDSPAAGKTNEEW